MREVIVTVLIFEDSTSEQNKTFYMTMHYTVVIGGQQFGINQAKAIGIISPTLAGMCIILIIVTFLKTCIECSSLCHYDILI